VPTLLLTEAVIGVGVRGSQADAQNAEARAVAFLVREVPRWKLENDCYSCHNNGDAARALIAAAARGFAVGTAMDDTLDWLRRPLGWNKNKTTGGIDDKPLARIQFASALRLAVEAGRASRDALSEAAQVVAGDQKPDGSWQLDTSQSLGSPATYGTTLATAAARRTLAASARQDVKAAVAKADQWILAAKVDTVIDAAAVILALERADDASVRTQRERALRTLQAGQGSDGGWGPYMTVGPQVFDTALALLALSELSSQISLAAPVFTASQHTLALSRGRKFLQSQQNADGSWPETTRPANQESYAQRLSTTGWALLALLATAR
jgi:squalene cyclase